MKSDAWYEQVMLKKKEVLERGKKSINTVARPSGNATARYAWKDACYRQQLGRASLQA